MERLTKAFFKRDPVSCARELVGCHLRWDGCEGRIVETEAYDSVGDEACHTWMRPSAREFVSCQQAGDAYVYLNYGVHWLFNVLVKGGGREGFVLLRAIEPVKGIERMRKRRGDFKDHLLGAGPGRLTQALGITGEDHASSFLDHKNRGLWRDRGVKKLAIGPRIGISKAVDLAWRFGDPASRCLSKKF